MANQTTVVRPPITGASAAAYAIGFLIGAAALIAGLAIPSIAWSAFGIWALASTGVLLIARAPGRPGGAGPGTPGAIFQVENWAWWVVLGLGVVAALVIIFAR